MYWIARSLNCSMTTGSRHAYVCTFNEFEAPVQRTTFITNFPAYKGAYSYNLNGLKLSANSKMLLTSSRCFQRYLLIWSDNIQNSSLWSNYRSFVSKQNREKQHIASILQLYSFFLVFLIQLSKLYNFPTFFILNLSLQNAGASLNCFIWLCTTCMPSQLKLELLNTFKPFLYFLWYDWK